MERKEGLDQTIWLHWLHKNMWKMNKDSGIVCMLEGYLVCPLLK